MRFGSHLDEATAGRGRCRTAGSAFVPIRAGRYAEAPDLRDLFGFAITADPGIDTSRQASGEVGLFVDALKAATIMVDGAGQGASLIPGWGGIRATRTSDLTRANRLVT